MRERVGERNERTTDSKNVIPKGDRCRKIWREGQGEMRDGQRMGKR